MCYLTISKLPQVRTEAKRSYILRQVRRGGTDRGTYVYRSCVPGRRVDIRAEHASVDHKPQEARPLRLHATNHHP